MSYSCSNSLRTTPMAAQKDAEKIYLSSVHKGDSWINNTAVLLLHAFNSIYVWKRERGIEFVLWVSAYFRPVRKSVSVIMGHHHDFPRFFLLLRRKCKLVGPHPLPGQKKHWSALSVYDYFVCDVFVPKCYYKQSCHPLHFSAPFLNEQVDSSSAICGWRVISLEYSYRNMQWSKRGRKRERKWQRDQGNFTRTDNLVGGILKMATTDSQPFSSVSFEEWN